MQVSSGVGPPAENANQIASKGKRDCSLCPGSKKNRKSQFPGPFHDPTIRIKAATVNML